MDREREEAKDVDREKEGERKKDRCTDTDIQNLNMWLKY